MEHDMNTETAKECSGDPARKLVDARFVRPLAERERARLESHLASCGSCSERYRRLQLADRVASIGPQRALDEPSPFEIERIARDLGLVEAPRPWWQGLLGSRAVLAGVPAAVAAAALVLVFVFPQSLVEQRDRGQLIERGTGPKPVSFAAYVVGRDSRIRLHANDAAVYTSEYLKLRVAAAGVAKDALRSVQVVIVGERGGVSVLKMSVPDDRSPLRTVSGAVVLNALPPGHAVVYAIGAKEDLDEEAIRAAAAKKPGASELASALGDRVLGIDRFELDVHDVKEAPKAP
jgi:hypothetical protein